MFSTTLELHVEEIVCVWESCSSSLRVQCDLLNTLTQNKRLKNRNLSLGLKPNRSCQNNCRYLVFWIGYQATVWESIHHWIKRNCRCNTQVEILYSCLLPAFLNTHFLLWQKICIQFATPHLQSWTLRLIKLWYNSLVLFHCIQDAQNLNEKVDDIEVQVDRGQNVFLRRQLMH